MQRRRASVAPVAAVTGGRRPVVVRPVAGPNTVPSLADALQPKVLRIAVAGYLAAGAGIGAAAAGVVTVAAWPLIAGALAAHALVTATVGRGGEDALGFMSKTEPDLVRAHRGLSTGFSRVRSAAGMKALQKLTYEYTRLEPLLGQRRPTDSFALGRLPGLALDVFRQGVSVLQSALDLMWVCGPEDYARLRAEEAELERQVAGQSRSPDRALSAGLGQERLATTRSLLDLTLKHRERVVRLLHESDKCAVSLHRLRMDLASLRTQDSDLLVAAAVQSLGATVEAARAVHEEVRRLISLTDSVWEPVPAIGAPDRAP